LLRPKRLGYLMISGNNLSGVEIAWTFWHSSDRSA
jgi:hypothetical protein